VESGERQEALQFCHYLIAHKVDGLAVAAVNRRLLLLQLLLLLRLIQLLLPAIGKAPWCSRAGRIGAEESATRLQPQHYACSDESSRDVLDAIVVAHKVQLVPRVKIIDEQLDCLQETRESSAQAFEQRVYLLRKLQPVAAHGSGAVKQNTQLDRRSLLLEAAGLSGIASNMQCPTCSSASLV
jgi:hypothetical protein